MKDGKNIIIGVLLISLMIMAVGYATFAQTLNIEGNATIAGEWDVEIIGIDKSYTGTATDSEGKPSATATVATFDTLLYAPGDSATYTIKVKNLGNITASLNDIELLPQGEDGSEAIKYEIVSAPEKGSVLNANEEATVVIKVTYDSNVTENPTVKSKTFSGVIEYVQAK